MDRSLRGKTMDTAAVRAALAVLDVLYVTDDINDTLGIVCDPEMRATQSELNTAIEAISTQEGVFRVTQGSRGSNTLISAQFSGNNKAANKLALYKLLAPKFVLGRAWGRVVRDGEGHHRNTFLCIKVASWAATDLLALVKRGEVPELKQAATSTECVNYRDITTIGFTAPNPSRDPDLNRTVVAGIAEKLGVMLDNPGFTVEDSIIYAAMPECNRKGDPIDALPGDSA